MTTKRLLLVAFAITITFVQEQMLFFLPNVQFTVVLIIVFTSVFTFKESVMYIIAYVLLDNMYMGGFNLFYMIPMMFAWLLIPISYHTFLKKTENEYHLAYFALAFGFVYGWSFIPFNMLQTGVDNFWVYLSADILFEIIMAVVGFISVLVLYKPLVKAFHQATNYTKLKQAKSMK